MKPMITYMEQETRRHLIKKCDGWLVPPLSGDKCHPKGKNPNKHWVDDAKRGGGDNNYPVSITCGWCGNNTFSWSETNEREFSQLDKNTASGTMCSFCGRNLQLYYKNWAYRAEFEGGGVLVQFYDGSTSLAGNGDSSPIIEWGHPVDMRFIHIYIGKYKDIDIPREYEIFHDER